MSDSSTTRMLAAYIEQRVSPELFLQSFFQISERNFHNSDFVEIDIRRGEPHLATPVQSVQSGARKIEVTKYENKNLKPPVYDLETTLSSFQLYKRIQGRDPFQDPDFREALRNESFLVMNDIEDMVKRAVELQCAQVFQGGVVSLKDSSNSEIYTIDYGMRPSHIITTTAWAADGSTGLPLNDLEAAGMEVARHGKRKITDVIFGSTARKRYFVSDQVKEQADNLGMQRFQSLAPASRPGDAVSLGRAFIGNTEVNLWGYDAEYIDPVTQELTPYVAANKVIVLAGDGRRDMTFGGLPERIIPQDARIMQFLPPRMNSAASRFDLTTNLWVTPDGKHLTMSAGTRPLAVPTALDTHAVLTVA